MCAQSRASPKDSSILMWGMAGEYEKKWDKNYSKAFAVCQGQVGALALPEVVIQTHILEILVDWLYFIQCFSRHDTLNVIFRQSVFPASEAVVENLLLLHRLESWAVMEKVAAHLVWQSLLSVATCYFSSPTMSICDHLTLVPWSLFLLTFALPSMCFLLASC